MPLTTIADPIAATTHPDPYPYYSELLAERPLYRDDDLTAWVASSADYVEALFHDSSAHVRPAAEPVPQALDGTGAGAVFGMLARMNDGERHRSLRETVELLLENLSEFSLRTSAVADVATGVDDFIERLPVYAMASMLGFAKSDLPAIVPLVRAMAQSFAANASAGAIANGSAAAHELIERCTARSQGQDFSVMTNVLGLLFQSYDATRGLIGNTLVALGKHAHVLQSVQRGTDALSSVVEETVRYDSPVQNTRRFLVDDVSIGNATLHRGDTVLLLIAAANRDEHLNPNPHRFDATRQQRRTFTFGEGPHACPGKTIAVAIATSAVEHLLKTGFDASRASARITYHRSANIRMPLFDSIQ